MELIGIKPTGMYSIKETMNALGYKSHNTLQKYVELGFIVKHYHVTGKPFFKGIDIIKFHNQPMF